MRRVRSSAPQSVVRRLVGSVLAVLAVVAGVLVVLSVASAAPKGVVGFTGNPGTAGSGLGGQFAAATALIPNPAGVAVSDSTGDVYVVDSLGHRVQRFDSAGNFDWAIGFDVVASGGSGNVAGSEQQTVTVGANSTGGTFTLRFGGVTAAFTSAPIPWNATPAQVDSALEGIAGIGAGNVAVTSSNPGGDAVPGGPYTVDFVGARADTNVPQMTAVATGLVVSSGAKSVTVATTVEGALAFERCVVASECKAGLATASPALGGAFSSPKGIAVNQASGDIYVSDGFFRVQQFDADGAFERAWGRDVIQTGKPGDSQLASAVQTLTVPGTVTAGTYALSFQGQSTSSLAYDATAAQVQAALEALSSIGTGNVTVTGGPGATAPLTITFAGALADTPVPAIAVDSSGLTGGSAAVANTTTGSNSFEICETAADCKAGTLAASPGGALNNILGYLAVTPAGANAGNVLIADSARSRVQEFTSSGAFVRAFGWDVVATGPGNDSVGTPNEFEICSASAFDVCKPGSTGSGIGQFTAVTGGTNPQVRVAVDSDGVIYTAEPTGTFRVQKFTPAGGGLTPSVFAPSVVSPTGTLTGTGAADSPTDVAFDPTTDHVYVVKAFGAGEGDPAAEVAERRILEFDPAGSLVETHVAGYGKNSVNGLAVQASGARMYLTTGSASDAPGFFTVDTPTPATVTEGATTAVTATTATLNGTINPNGGPTTYRFEYSPDGSSWASVPATNVNIGSGVADVAVTQDVTGLQPNRHYQVRLVANKSGVLTTSTGTVGDFDTDPAAPSAETLDAFWDGSTGELVLRGQVNPNNQPTDYYFEYGTDTGYGSSVPVGEDADAGAGGATVTVAERVSGLSAGDVYHYRLVAVNATGTTVGGDRVAAAYHPPEGRGYEWVSRGDSWGSGVGTSPQVLHAIADSGDRMEFGAQAFGQPSSSPAPADAPYMAQRSASGWSVKALVPPVELADASANGTVRLASPDLMTMLWPESTRSGRQRGEIRWGFAHDDGSHTWASPPIAPLDQAGTAAAFGDEYQLWGGSSDLSMFVFARWGLLSFKHFVDEPLVVTSVGSAQSNLYQVSGAGGPDPVLSLVNRDTNPSAGVLGAPIGGVCGAGLGARLFIAQNERNVSRAVSADGSVVYFTAVPGASGSACPANMPGRRLYKRVDDSVTVEVSAPQCSGTCLNSGSNNDVFETASVDGSVVVFTTTRQLVDADDDTTSDVYLYDASPPAGQPTLVQASAGEAVGGHVVGQGAGVDTVLDLSADGSRTYFTAGGVLAGANSRGVAPVAGQRNLYVFERSDAHPGGRIAFVGKLLAGDASEALQRAAFALPNHGAESDGRFLLFMASAKLLTEDTDAAQDVYRYDDASGELLCVSCAGDGDEDAVIARRDGSRSVPAAVQSSRPATADASTVVFATRDSLVSADANAVADVYLWREGTLSLVSGGTGEVGSATSGSPQTGVPIPPGISPDGRDVFFVTHAGLDAGDVNNQPDVYDARVGGGFAVAPAPPAPCDPLAGGCQGQGTLPLVSSPLTLSPLSGGENAVSGARATLRVRSLSRAQRNRLSAGKAVTLRVRVNRPGGVRVVGTSSVNGKRMRVLSSRRTASRAGLVGLRLRLSRPARRALVRKRTLTVALSVRFSGRSSTSTLRLTDRASTRARSAAATAGRRR